MNIEQFRSHMMNYQKFHKIKGECIANSIYYLDLLNSVEHGRYKPICGILVVEPKVIAHVWRVQTKQSGMSPLRATH